MTTCHTVNQIVDRSRVIREAKEAGKVLVVGAVYDVETGETQFLMDEPTSVPHDIPEPEHSRSPLAI